MENIADKMRRENAEKFETIKKELTDIVVNEVKEHGECRISTYTTEKGISRHNIYGIFIDQSFRLAVKKHFESLGFVVKNKFIGYTLHHSGYIVTL